MSGLHSTPVLNSHGNLSTQLYNQSDDPQIKYSICNKCTICTLLQFCQYVYLSYQLSQSMCECLIRYLLSTYKLQIYLYSISCSCVIYNPVIKYIATKTSQQFCFKSNPQAKCFSPKKCA